MMARLRAQGREPFSGELQNLSRGIFSWSGQPGGETAWLALRSRQVERVRCLAKGEYRWVEFAVWLRLG